MAGDKDKSRQTAAKRAQALTTEALDILDAHGVSPGASAHLELALQELRKAAKS